MIIKILAFFLLVALFPGSIEATDEGPEKTAVSINVEHGIPLPWGEPGFRIYIEGWGSETPLSIFIIDRDAKTIEAVSPDQNITSGEDGRVVFDVSYTLKGMVPGVCIIVVAGPPGFHCLTDEIPEVIPPSEDNEKWILRFGGDPTEQNEVE